MTNNEEIARAFDEIADLLEIEEMLESGKVKALRIEWLLIASIIPLARLRSVDPVMGGHDEHEQTLKEALIKSLHSSIRAFLQVFLRGKGYLSMSYNGCLVFPSPEPPSHGLIQRFLNQAYRREI